MTTVAPGMQGDNTLNRLRYSWLPLHFDVHYYETYDACDWTPFYKHSDYGEIGSGGVRGDRTKTKPLESGYVYVFTETSPGAYGLRAAFKVAAKKYHKLVSSAKSVDHDRTEGGPRDYAWIDRFFPGPLGLPAPAYFIVSPIPLSGERLFTSKSVAIVNNPSRRADRTVNVSWDRIVELVSETCKSSAQLTSDYRSGKSITINMFDFQRVKLGGRDGLRMFTPNAFAEALRRSARYLGRLSKYHAWRDDTARCKEAFIHRTVRTIVERESRYSSYVDPAKLKKWSTGDSEQYRKHFFPVDYAVKDVIDWLEDRRLVESLRDYSFGTDEQRQEAWETYGKAIHKLHLTPQGAAYLKAQYEGIDSYFNQTTQFYTDRSKYQNPSDTPNLFQVLRKWNAGAFEAMKEFVPTILERNKKTGIVAIQAFIKRVSGYALSVVSVKALSYVDRLPTVLDIGGLLKKVGAIPESKGGKGLLSFVEVANVGFAIWGLSVSETLSDFAKNGLNLLGAALDLGTSPWLEGALKHTLGDTPKLKLRLGIASIVSGVLDGVLGVWEASANLEQGDFDAFVGWSVFTVGAVLVVAGGAFKLAGGKVIVGTGGTGSEIGGVLVAIGVLVEAAGALIVWLCDDDEIEGWLRSSRFGSPPLFGSKPSYASLDEEIAALNRIVCRFEVEAEFQDIKGNFRNNTIVTLSIKPRAIDVQSEISIYKCHAKAEARVGEMLGGNLHDLAVGAAGVGDRVLKLNDPLTCKIIRKDGRIAEVRTSYSFDMDIDELTGTASLAMRNGHIEGYKTTFKVRA